MPKKQQRAGRKGKGKSKGKGEGKAEDEKRPELRFKVGDRVQCWGDFQTNDEDLFNLDLRDMIKQMILSDTRATWAHGTVIKLWYKEGVVHPYQVRLDDGALIFATRDNDNCIRKSDVPPLPPVSVDDRLFHQPPSREDCPLCFIPLPLQRTRQTKYYTCCGKVICLGCIVAAEEAGSMSKTCPFCRANSCTSDEEELRRMQDRMDRNDPEAFVERGVRYYQGTNGFKEDKKKAISLMFKAAELGLCTADYNIGCAYWRGNGIEYDLDKAKIHFGKSAIAGHGGARYNLGIIEMQAGYYSTAYKHFLIGAKSGYDDCLGMVKEGYQNGEVTKDDFAATLRAHKDSLDEIKSEQRDKALVKYHFSPSYEKEPRFAGKPRH